MKLIETAIDQNGDSYIHSINEPKSWQGPGHFITELYFSKKNPPNILATTEELTSLNFNLKPGEIRFFISSIAPTKETYEGLQAQGEQMPSFKKFFYHSTTTIDFVTVKKGPLVIIVGEKEIELQTGDCIIQRGAAHAWHNYSNEIAAISVVMIGVEPPANFNRVDTYQP